MIRRPDIIRKTKKEEKKTRERYWDLSEEEKSKKRESGYELYKSLPEDEKQSLAKYRKKYYKTWKNKAGSQIKTD